VGPLAVAEACHVPACLPACRADPWQRDLMHKLQRTRVLLVERGVGQDGTAQLDDEVQSYLRAMDSYEFPIRPELDRVLGKAVCLYGFGAPYVVLAAERAILSLVTNTNTSVPLEHLLPQLPEWLQSALEVPELREALPELLAHERITVYHPGWESVWPGQLEVRTGPIRPVCLQLVVPEVHQPTDPTRPYWDRYVCPFPPWLQASST
jgi:hypothetical protein